MVRPKILCRACSEELNPGDKFCSACGARIEWETTSANPQPQSEPPQQAAASGAVRCSLCGNENLPGDANCRSCGAALSSPAGSSRLQQGRTEHAERAGASSPMNTLQSWKLTAGMAVLLIAVLIYLKVSRSTGHDAEISTQQQPATQMTEQAPLVSSREIDSLQQQAGANPNDAVLQLKLANRLQDAKMLGRAIETYQRYLVLKPRDPDATVDLGVCFYELSASDSTHRMENLSQAHQAFETALKINPKHQLAQFNLGIVSLMVGDLKTANDWFTKAAATDPNSETGKRAQMLLHQHSFNNQPS